MKLKPYVSTTTAITFEENPDLGGGLLEMTHDKDIDWGSCPRFKAFYPRGMELVKRRSPFIYTLMDSIVNAFDKVLSGMGKITLVGACIGTAFFVLTLLLYYFKVFTGIQIIFVGLS